MIRFTLLTLISNSYQTTYMKNSNNLVWLNMATSLFWQNYVNAYRVGTSSKFANGDIAQYATPSASPVIFDTGTSMVYLPSCKF